MRARIAHWPPRVKRCYPIGVVRRLLDRTIVAVVREADEARARRIAWALVDAGIGAIEVTTNTPGCFDRISELSARAGLVVGVGTVTTREHVEAAARAGATFAVSPHTDPDLIRRTKDAGLIAIPGAMTPTEIVAARAAGADIVKLFPISSLGGSRFLELIRGPLPDVRCWVSGTVQISEIRDYLAKGASLIGLTSALTSDLDDDLEAAIAARVRSALATLDSRS